MSLFQRPPQFNRQDAVRIVAEHYDLRAATHPLPSERDQNFLIHAHDGDSYVLKIANAAEDREVLHLQNRVMQHLETRVHFCPRVVPNNRADLLWELPDPSESQTHCVRLISYVPGVPMGSIKRHSQALLKDLGRCLGQLDRALGELPEPRATREFPWDMGNAPRVVRQYQELVDDDEIRQLILQCTEHFENTVAPLLGELPKSIIHNDANDHNVLVGGDKDLATRHHQVVGIIDFGDIAYSYTVAEPAIAMAYAALGKRDPLAAAEAVAAGYHSERPFSDQELGVLFGMMRMRLCVSACMAAWQMSQRSENDYLFISQPSIRRTLPRLMQPHPHLAEARFRKACQLQPVPQSRRVIEWLKQKAPSSPVEAGDLQSGPVVVFDLGIDSPIFQGDPLENSEASLTRRLNAIMEKAGARVGIGRYDEARMLYTSPDFRAGERPTDEHRTVHLGLDLFAATGVPVLAPLDGVVAARAENDRPLDYGPVVILEHQTDRGDTFYTLYGHLSRASLQHLQLGQTVVRGQTIGWIGGADVNGGYTPHLHFQIIVDLLDLGCHFPGVARASQREVWCEFCPDPNLLVDIPEERFPSRAPEKAATLAARRKHVGRNLKVGYCEPVKIVRGWKQFLFDETGRRFLDAYNNVPHVGHCHPRVVRAASEQMGVLNTNTRYLHDHINRYAERLSETLPDPLAVCFFVNSASEGNELALRLARSYTGQRDFIVLEAAYHGHTSSMIDISPYKHAGPGGSGAPGWVHTAPIADVYRGLYRTDDPDAGVHYAEHVRQIVDALAEQSRGPAAFIAESCPSVGGQVFFPPGYLAAVYGHVRAAGGICIADEVQTGYGRIGTHFYAFEAQGVVPDIVVLGKPIGNGHPIGVVITTSAIAEAFDNGMEFFSTFGGNTVSCRIGLTVLQIVVEEDLQNNARRVGNRLLEGMAAFPDRYAIVGDVRGSGLFVGVELVRDRHSLEPAADEAIFIAERMRERGILLGTDGPFHNVLKIRPPMPFTEGDADYLLSMLDEVLTESFGS